MRSHNKGSRGRRGRSEKKGRRSETVPEPRHAALPSDRGQSPALTREVRRLLEGIGTPRPTAFKPDPFQTEALAALEFEDVLVTAPTGSGKTWIAREEIRRLLAAGKRA